MKKNLKYKVSKMKNSSIIKIYKIPTFICACVAKNNYNRSLQILTFIYLSKFNIIC